MKFFFKFLKIYKPNRITAAAAAAIWRWFGKVIRETKSIRLREADDLNWKMKFFIFRSRISKI